MTSADLVRLFALATLWGASFLLFRIAVPGLGALATTEARVAIAGLVLLAWHGASRTPLAWHGRVRPIAIVGVFNSALPFALFAFASKTLPAGYLAILNATTPLFGALIARVWFGETLGVRRLAGVCCGIAGVAVLVNPGPSSLDATTALAAAAGLVASLSYGFAGNYTRQIADPVPPSTMATGAQLAAAIALLPLLPFEPPRAWPTTTVIVAVCVLAIACTSIAYLLFFRLIRDIGATRAMTVTFLVPPFAIVWGWLVLGEIPTPRMGVGTLLIGVATWLVLRPAGVSASRDGGAR